MEFPAHGLYRLSRRSLARLRGVHPDLLAVVRYAIRVTSVDFGVPATGGVRTLAQQRALVHAGRSRTIRSRHRTGHAVDVYAFVDGRASWYTPHILAIHDAFVVAGAALAVPLRWGGDWDGDGDTSDQKFRDLVHHELPRATYGDGTAHRSKLARDFLRHCVLSR